MTSILKVDNIQNASGTAAMAIDGSGNITIPQAVTGMTLSDNIVFNTANKGIHLGVTSAQSTNLLNDYETGTFTPSWNGYPSPHATAGSYTKIGRQVVVYAELVTANVNDTSEVQIDNLPFTISGNRGGGLVWHNRTSLYAFDLLTVMNANTTGCKLNTVTGSSNVVGVKYVDSGEPTLGGFTTLRWTIFYETS